MAEKKPDPRPQCQCRECLRASLMKALEEAENDPKLKEQIEGFRKFRPQAPKDNTLYRG